MLLLFNVTLSPTPHTYPCVHMCVCVRKSLYLCLLVGEGEFIEETCIIKVDDDPNKGQ